MRSLNRRLIEVIRNLTNHQNQKSSFKDDFTASAWKESTNKNTTFVAVKNCGQQIGYVNVREGMDDIAAEKCAYIALLADMPEVEGEGVAKSLVQAAENWSKEMGFTRVSLDVFARNLRGQRFYEKKGNKPETIRVIKQLS